MTGITDVEALPLPSDPAETALRRDLATAPLLAAADDGRFGVLTWRFPIVIAWIAIGVSRVGLRLDCVAYPTQAPAGQLWDLRTNTALPVERWPRGGRAEKVFRPDWSPSNEGAPYLACDRVALRGHPDWARTLGNSAWNPQKTLIDYLEQVALALRNSALPAVTS
jgi:hypothetical protein